MFPTEQLRSDPIRQAWDSRGRTVKDNDEQTITFHKVEKDREHTHRRVHSTREIIAKAFREERNG